MEIRTVDGALSDHSAVRHGVEHAAARHDHVAATAQAHRVLHVSKVHVFEVRLHRGGHVALAVFDGRRALACRAEQALHFLRPERRHRDLAPLDDLEATLLLLVLKVA